jgi:hypothetical protein
VSKDDIGISMDIQYVMLCNPIYKYYTYLIVGDIHGYFSWAYFSGILFLMVIQRRMDQSMKRGMEQSNAMGWMVEKPWMTLLVGFIYIYPRYPKISPQEKDRNKKSGFLAACLFVQSSEYPKALVL